MDKKLVKRIENLEKNNKVLKKQVDFEVKKMNYSFKAYKEVMEKLRAENLELRRSLLEKSAETVKGPAIEDAAMDLLRSKLKTKFMENVDFVKKVAKEDLMHKGINEYEDYEKLMKGKKK